MDTPYQQTEPGTDVHSLAAVIREIRTGFVNVIKSDLDLAKVELRETTGRLKSDVIRLAVFGAVAALGVLPFMAFLVIGLGDLFGGNYWLSALIVSAVFFAVGGGVAYAAVNRLKQQDLSLPHTRRALDQEIAAVDRKLNHVVEVSKERMELDMKMKKGRAA